VVRHFLVVIACIAAVGAIGCGGGSGPSDEDQIRTVVNGFTTAVATSNGQRACSYLTDLARKSIEVANFGRRCPEVIMNKAGIRRERFASAKISRVAQSGTEAVVSFENVRDPMQLHKTGDKWKIEATVSITTLHF
jgi:hypothetical protein